MSLDVFSLDDFETIETSGLITANGLLEINFADGFLPAAGQSFDLLDFGQIVGGFDFISSNGARLDTSDLFIGGSVSIAAVPEPGAFVVLGLTGLVFASRRRRNALPV